LRNRRLSIGVDGDNVVFELLRGALSAISDPHHGRVTEKVFAGTKTNSKFVIVPWCSHGRSDQVSVEPNLKWLFDNDLVRNA